jgi:uncharacterized oligopeptide transporter (OPT) family protein
VLEVTPTVIVIGLKTGFGFPAPLFGAIFGFGILKTISNVLPEKFPVFGGFFGLKENSIVQTVTVTSGGLFFIFVSGVPTLYQMGLLLASPQQDYWKLTALTFVCAYYGLMFAAPMRHFFLVTVAREMNLVFPSCKAAPYTERGNRALGRRGHSSLGAVGRRLPIQVVDIDKC